MIIRESFYLLRQGDQTSFVPIKVPQKVEADIPDIIRICVGRCENIEQVLHVHVL